MLYSLVTIAKIAKWSMYPLQFLSQKVVLILCEFMLWVMTMLMFSLFKLKFIFFVFLWENLNSFLNKTRNIVIFLWLHLFLNFLLLLIIWFHHLFLFFFIYYRFIFLKEFHQTLSSILRIVFMSWSWCCLNYTSTGLNLISFIWILKIFILFTLLLSIL